MRKTKDQRAKDCKRIMDNLEAIRSIRGKTYEECAERCNISRQTYSKIVSHPERLTIGAIGELCCLFDVSMEKVICGSVIDVTREVL